MASQDILTQSTVRDEEDIFQILIATDIHLGYAEDDPVRGHDTFDTFEEILQIAAEEEVDFILLGGDLFHNAQPSPYCLNKCMELLKKYCLGDRPVSVEFLSDPSRNFSQSLNPTVNYEDPNLNISLPVFTIHGNHDDPTGTKHISTLDLLSTSGLVNYFGKCTNLDKVEISPILVQKGKTKLALYGLSHIRDERLGRLFLDEKVKILSPENKEEWFHLLVWHQNRASRGSKNFIPDNCLPDFLDLIIWGHEHDCRIEPEQKNKVFISQPGSSVATSLIEGESITKKVGILKIHQNSFIMNPIELKTVRPFKYAETTLPEETQGNGDNKCSASEQTKEFVASKIDRMIRKAKTMGREAKVTEKPLIRLIVKYKNESNVFNAIRFGQLYDEKVANPDNMIKFQLDKEHKRKKKVQNIDGEEEEILQGPILANRVEDLVAQHFAEHNTLRVFPLRMLNESVKKFVDSNDANAITDVTASIIQEMLKSLEKDLPEVEDTEKAIGALKDKIEGSAIDFVNTVLDNPSRQKKKVTADEENDAVMLSDDEDDDGVGASKTKKTPTRGKGSRGRRGAGARGGRGRGASSSKVMDDDDIDDDSDDDGRTTKAIKTATKAPTRAATKAPTRATRAPKAATKNMWGI